jgi:hypothetical protein
MWIRSFGTSRSVHHGAADEMDDSEDLAAELEEIFETRRALFMGFGYNESEAIRLALSDAVPNDVHDKIADLQRRGCPMRLAREIAR